MDYGACKSKEGFANFIYQIVVNKDARNNTDIKFTDIKLFSAEKQEIDLFLNLYFCKNLKN